MLINTLSSNVFLNTGTVTRVVIASPTEKRNMYSVSCICGDERWQTVFEADTKEKCVEFVENTLKGKF